MKETIFMSSSVTDQKSISSSPCNNQLKKLPSGNNYTRTNFMWRSNYHDHQNKAPTNIIHGGLLLPPATTYVSLPNRQPPLLPLPPPQSIHASLPGTRTQNLSSSSSCPSPMSNRSKINRNRYQSLTPKKSKPKKTIMSEKEQVHRKGIDSKPTKAVVGSVQPLGPDPKDLPRNVPKVFLAPPSTVMAKNDFPDLINVLSGSLFTLAPPPSSLPLPNFSLRPKRSCNAEAAKIDAGATDDLRRFLRLR